MKRCFITLAFIFVAVSVAVGQTAQTDEQIIRDLVQRSDTDVRVIKLTNNPIFVSGLYPRPIIGKPGEEEKKTTARVQEVRKNPKRKTETVRLVISESKDMAYEFSNFTMSWDDKDGKRTGFEGSYLRIWRKVGGEWHEEAMFARPNEPAGGSEKK